MQQNILVVEDDTGLRGLFRSVLEKEGYNVSVAADGEEAMDALRRSSPDIVILDMDLPFVSGFQIIRHIRAQQTLEGTRVIVVSANTHVPATYEADMADVVLMKPVSMAQLKTMVARMSGTPTARM